MRMKALLLVLGMGMAGPLSGAYLVPFRFDFTTSRFLSADPNGAAPQARISYSLAAGTAYSQSSPGVVNYTYYGDEVQGVDGEKVGLGGAPAGALCAVGAYICKNVFSQAQADFGLLKAEAHAVSALGVTITNPNTNQTTVYTGQTDVMAVAMFADVVQGNSNGGYSIDLSYAYDGTLTARAGFLYRLAAVFLDRGGETPDGFEAPGIMVSNVSSYDSYMDAAGFSFPLAETTPGTYNDSGVFQIGAQGQERILIFGELLTFHQEIDTGSAVNVGGGTVGSAQGARFFNTAKITAVAVSDGVTLSSENGVDWVNIGVVDSQVPEPATVAMVGGAGLLMLMSARRRRQ